MRLSPLVAPSVGAPPTAPLIRSLATGLLWSACALMLVGCAGDSDSGGAYRARQAAQDLADRIGAHSENANSITTIEMVAWWVPEGPVPAGDGMATAEPLAWSGAGAGTSATIDVRIHASVSAESEQIGAGLGAGEATRCFRLEWHQYAKARRSEIRCPDGPAPARPTPPPRPQLTVSDRDTIVALLKSAPTATALAAALRAEFPGDDFRIETDEANGGIIAAVGIPAERECVLAFRDAVGTITFPDFRQIWLEPGETGCSTDLYTNPPR